MEEVTCELQYSGVAEAFLALAVGATLAVVVLVPFGHEARALMFGWVVGGATAARAKLRRVRRLRLSCDGQVELHEEGGVRIGRVVPGSFVAPWLTIVRWRPAGARLCGTLLLLPGMARSDALRKIRVILRWG